MKKIIFPILVALIVAGVSAIFFWNPYIKILLPAYLGSSSAQYKAAEYYEEKVEEKEKSGNKDNISKDAESAVKWLKKCAEKGNADCQNHLGLVFYARKDYSSAMQWYMKAAEKENYEAQCEIGRLYVLGLGVEMNVYKAVEWFEKSVKKNSYCAHLLGTMYENGSGVKQDYSKALELYKKSAEDGNATGAFCLGNMYYLGRGVDENVFTAKEWYDKAVKSGGRYNNVVARAAYILGTIYQEDGIKGYKKAFEYYSIAAEKGDAEAQKKLCFMYARGQGIEKDHNKAVLMAKKAEANGQSDVLFSLGIGYYYGWDQYIGIESDQPDKAKAADVLELSAEQGSLHAQNFVAKMYYIGDGVSTDTAKAFKWYAKAAEQGSVESQLQLADMLYEGIGTEQNYQKAFEWYTKAAEQGNAIAEERLGDCFVSGKGTEKNINEGINWYNKAMQKGSTTAKEKLSEYYFALAEQNKSDKDEAVKLYEKAAEIGNMKAVYALLSIYAEEGKEEQAVEIYAKAAENGTPTDKDCLRIAKLYEQYDNNMTAREKRDGGDHKNEIKKWYMKAADLGNMEAMETMLKEYKQNKEYYQAETMLEKMLEHGKSDAGYQLGMIYATGMYNRTKNDDKAYDWFVKAAEKGDLKSQALSIYLDYREDDEPTLRKHAERNSGYIKNLVQHKYSRESFLALCKDYERKMEDYAEGILAKEWENSSCRGKVSMFSDMEAFECGILFASKFSRYVRNAQEVFNNIVKKNKEFAGYYKEPPVIKAKSKTRKKR